MKEITIQLTEEQWQEILQNLEYWSDESYALHAAYYFREALVRAGYISE